MQDNNTNFGRSSDSRSRYEDLSEFWKEVNRADISGADSSEYAECDGAHSRREKSAGYSHARSTAAHAAEHHISRAKTHAEHTRCPARKPSSRLQTVFLIAALASALLVTFLVLFDKGGASEIIPTPEPTPTATPEPVDMRKYEIDTPETGSEAVDAFIAELVERSTDEFNSAFDINDAETLKITSSGVKTETAYSFTYNVEFPDYKQSDVYCLSLEDAHEMTIDEALGENIRRYLWNFFDYSLPDMAEQTGKLTADYDLYIAAEDTNFNTFLLTEDGGVSIIFDRGTLNADDVVTLSAGADVVGGEFWNTRHVRTDRPMVALTFDDGPSEDFTPIIYECLEKYHAVATFFDVGTRVEKWPELVKQGFDMNCEMASHTYWHTYLDSYDYEALAYDKELVDAAFMKAIGQTPSLVRPPEGRVGGAALGLYKQVFCGWSVDTLDWLTQNSNTSFETVKNYGNLDGQVILLHSIYMSSVEAATMIIPWLIEQGYQLVTMSELLEYGYGITEPDTTYYYAVDFFMKGRGSADASQTVAAYTTPAVIADESVPSEESQREETQEDGAVNESEEPTGEESDGEATGEVDPNV